MISSTTNRVAYTGNNSTSVYSYGCRIFAETDVRVTVRLIASPYTETQLTLTTDYTVGGIGNSTGNITLVNASQAWLTSGNLLSTYKLVIRRVRPLTQATSIRNYSSFYPAGHEDFFDHAVMVMQQLQDLLDRSIHLPETVPSSVFDPSIPIGIVNAAGKVLVINDGGSGLDLLEPADSMFMGAQTSFSATDGQSAASLTGETASGAVYSSVVYQYEILRGTTVFSTGMFSLHYRNSAWYLVLGEERYDNVSHGVTFSITGTTTFQLKAALDVGAGNGTIKLKKHKFAA